MKMAKYSARFVSLVIEQNQEQADLAWQTK